MPEQHFHSEKCWAAGPGDTEVLICGQPAAVIMAHVCGGKQASTCSRKSGERTMTDPRECTHQHFEASVAVGRMLDAGKFVADVRVRCSECNEPFRFVGVPAGLSFESPTVSIDGLELHAPIEPEIEKRLQERATYQMPEIPKRH